ncbi:MAG: permease-like cell division protein FtsX [Acidobacteriota bacterium]
MTFIQALRYFVREAALSLARSWKVSALAILTIAVSLGLTGAFLLINHNLHQRVAQWQRESKVVLYLDGALAEADRQALIERVAAAPWVDDVALVDAATSRARFVENFPSLADLLEGWGEEPLPASLEVQIDAAATADRASGSGDLTIWLAGLRDDPAVIMVDDDRDWLAQLETVIWVLRGAGLLLGGVLLITAVFTIASVIRLTAYLYRDEIAVMRMVGATEFFIRGPFYLEGLLQGLLGGLAACGALAMLHTMMIAPPAGGAGFAAGGDWILTALAQEFLPTGQVLGLIALGGLAGLVGAVVSLRRESLGRTQEIAPSWIESADA